MKLYPDTVLHKNRTRYLSLEKGLKLVEFLNLTRQRLKNLGLNSFVTAFYYRKKKNDAIIEFASAETASRAGEVLAGVYPWKPEYQSIFLDYFENGNQTDVDMKHSVVVHNLPLVFDSGKFLDFVKQQLQELHGEKAVDVDWGGMSTTVYCTTLRLVFQTRMGDALVEFANPKLATTAVSALNGLVIGQMKVSAQPWKAEYQTMFVKYFESQKQPGIEVQKEPNHTSDYSPLDRDYRDPEQPTQQHGLEGTMEEPVDINAKVAVQSSAMSDETEASHRQISENKQQNNADNRAHDGHVPGIRIVSPNESEPSVSSAGASNNELKTRLDQANSQIELLSNLLERTKAKVKAIEAEKQAISAEKQTMEKKVSDLEMENESLQEELEQTRMNHQMEMGMAGL
ncbi:MAG: hypothetical protein SGBAC_010675 [Bacillariaceae sp.]